VLKIVDMVEYVLRGMKKGIPVAQYEAMMGILDQIVIEISERKL